MTAEITSAQYVISPKLYQTATIYSAAQNKISSLIREALWCERKYLSEPSVKTGGVHNLFILVNIVLVHKPNLIVVLANCHTTNLGPCIIPEGSLYTLHRE